MTGDARAVTVRPARPGDLPALVEALGQEHYFAHRLGRQPRLGILLIAERADGALLGCAFLRLLPAEEWELRERLPKVPVFSHLQVVKQQQGNGVGTMIVQAAEDEARRRGRKMMLLGVRLDEDGQAARRMYVDRLGYQDWERGPINALVETYDEKGQRTYGTERCLILVKSL